MKKSPAKYATRAELARDVKRRMRAGANYSPSLKADYSQLDALKEILLQCGYLRCLVYGAYQPADALIVGFND